MVEIVLPVMGIFAGPSQEGLCIRHITVRHKTNNDGKRERKRERESKRAREQERERERENKQENDTEMLLYADIV